MTKSITVGVVTEAFDSGFHTPFFGALHRALQRIGGRLVFVQGIPRTLVETGLATDGVDGWIVLNAPDGAVELAQAGKPVLTSSCRAGDLPAVLTDNRAGVLEVMQHLIGIGRTQIAFIGWLENRDFQERYEAYCEALTAHGLPINPDLVIDPAGYDIVQCSHAFAQLLDRGVVVDAVVGANDKAAIGAIHALRENGRRVPEDVAAVGFDDTDIARLQIPPLSSVRNRPDEIARVALRVLVDLIHGRGAPAVTRVAASAVFRQSSRAGALAPTARPEPDRYRGLDWRALLARDLVQIALAPAPLDPELPAEQIWPTVGRLVDSLGELERAAVPPELPADVWREGAEIAGGIAAMRAVLELMRQAGLQRLQQTDTAALDRFSAWLLTSYDQVAGATTLELASQFERQQQSIVTENLLLTHFTRSGADPTLIDWMQNSWADWAALALWERGGQRRTLKVASVFERGVGAQISGALVPAAEFPAASLAAEQFSRSSEYILKLSPLRSPAREWGYLATYERYRSPGYDTLTSRNTFVAAMLERDELLGSLTERQEVLQLAYERERGLADTIRELGCPLIPLLPGVLMVPLVGSVDEQRAQQIIERVLEGVSQEQASRVLLDITGVPIVDTHVAAALIQMARAVGLLGARVILVGVRPEIAQSIVSLNIDLATIETRPTLASALQILLRRQS
jgi:DNA-binding LacI/PurR family transcriptional regulator/anti-anti-sigma regulatory factor